VLAHIVVATLWRDKLERFVVAAAVAQPVVAVAIVATVTVGPNPDCIHAKDWQGLGETKGSAFVARERPVPPMPVGSTVVVDVVGQPRDFEEQWYPVELVVGIATVAAVANQL